MTTEWAKAVKNGEEFHQEYRWIHADGEIVWTVGDIVPVIGSDGEVAVYIGTLTDITERKKVEEALKRRDAILKAVSFSAGKFLLASCDEDYIHEVLKEVGNSAKVSRIYIFENEFGSDGKTLVSQRYEWAASGVTPQIDNPQLQKLSYEDSGFGRWLKTLSKGEIISGNVKDFPQKERELLEPQDIISIVVVPIFVEDKWWGFIGFDECIRERDWTQGEIDALQTSASIFSAEIQRQRAEEKLYEYQNSLKSLASELLLAEERERRRIAAYLHDHISQALALERIEIGGLRKSVGSADKKVIEELSGRIKTVIESVQSLTFDLSSPTLYKFGLEKAVDEVLDELFEKTEINYKLSHDKLPIQLDNSLSVLLFRGIRELLVNIIKHARAHKVRVAIQRGGDNIQITVNDDGVGFDFDQNELTVSLIWK